jgi:hypothetical protein
MPDNFKEPVPGADEVFCELGRFFVKFEHVIRWMGTAVTFILQRNGLRNQQLAHILLAEQTAYPIKSMLQAMVVEVAQLNAEEVTIINSIFKRVQDLIDQRNMLVHSFTVVGQADGKADFAADGYKLSRGRSGAGVKAFSMTATELRNLSTECIEVERLIDHIQITLLTEKKFTETFVVSKGAVTLLAR